MGSEGGVGLGFLGGLGLVMGSLDIWSFQVLLEERAVFSSGLPEPRRGLSTARLTSTHPFSTPSHSLLSSQTIIFFTTHHCLPRERAFMVPQTHPFRRCRGAS